MSASSPLSLKGCKMRDHCVILPTPLGFCPPFGKNAYLMVPTGQCIDKKRGGEVIPCAMASKSRSMILSPKAPPMPARNERRAKRYDLCKLASGTLGKSLGQRDRTHEGGE